MPEEIPQVENVPVGWILPPDEEWLKVSFMVKREEYYRVLRERSTANPHEFDIFKSICEATGLTLAELNVERVYFR